MTISLRVARRPKATRRQDPARPSVREVCLLGVSRELTQGDRLSWSGRSYRVEATREGYAHLAPVPDEASGLG